MLSIMIIIIELSYFVVVWLMIKNQIFDEFVTLIIRIILSSITCLLFFSKIVLEKSVASILVLLVWLVVLVVQLKKIKQYKK